MAVLASISMQPVTFLSVGIRVSTQAQVNLFQHQLRHFDRSGARHVRRNEVSHPS